MVYKNQYYLNIADIIISLSIADDNIELIISEPVSAFVSKNTEISDVSINIYNYIPEKFKFNKLLFFADKTENNNSQDISTYKWCICRSENIKFIKIFEKQNIDIPEIIASFDENAKNWNIYFNTSNINTNKFQIDPFIYPLGPLIIYYIINFYEGIMIHASGIIDNNKGYIFSGLSGVGKTTISKIWKNEKAQLINDDRLIIRKKQESYFIYNTPMNYTADSKIGTLNNIFLLKQSAKNYSKKFEGSEAIARLMSNCIQHNYDECLISSLITHCSDISTNIPIYELGFVPDQNIVKFIRSNEFN